MPVTGSELKGRYLGREPLFYWKLLHYLKNYKGCDGGEKKADSWVRCGGGQQ